MTILIENALMLDGKRADTLIEENRIAAINPKQKDRSDVVIDATKKAIVPGLFNMHTHAAMILLKGYADDYELHEWLTQHIFPMEAKLKPKHVYYGTLLACAEMIHSGTTCFNDMYFFEEEIAKAVERAGMRAVVSKALTTQSYNRAEAKKAIKKLSDFERVLPALGPHAIYTTDKETLCDVKELASELDVLIHFHLSETKKEVEDCLKEHGKRPAEYLKEIGFLSNRVINAHCVWLNEREIKIVAESGAKMVSCPTSNLKLASGIAPLTEIVDAGIATMLGTDGSASNNSLNMFETIKLASLLQKYKQWDATALPAEQAFELATINAAKALNLKAGVIKEGFLADLCLIDLTHISMVPCYNLISNIVFSAEPACVDTVICNGRILMENRVIGWEADIKEKAMQVAEELLSE
ncbi:MAG: amidohydrolase [Candidatus Diapherotrites archaeon]|nr:amidohydrolase [Candidatus Diapherotrites archaeon]